MRTIGRGTLLVVGALGLTLATAGYASASGTFVAAPAAPAAPAEVLDLAAVSAPAYTLVRPDDGAAAGVDPATGEPPGPCRTGELRISSRAGSLVFENITGHACSVQGHPGVTAATGPFAASGAGAPQVLLAPGERLRAALQSAPETCQTTVRVPGYEVSAPGDTTTVFVGAPHQACSAGTVAAFTAAG